MPDPRNQEARPVFHATNHINEMAIDNLRKKIRQSEARERAYREALVRLRNCAVLVVNMRENGPHAESKPELDPQRVLDVADAALAANPSEEEA